MPEDGEIVHHEHSEDKHPAHFDQQLAKIRDLLPEAKAFVVCLLVPDEDSTSESIYSHVVIGQQPGVSTPGFLNAAIQDIVEAANDMLIRDVKEEDEE